LPYPLAQRLGELDRPLDVEERRNDQTSLAEIESLGPERIIISPGPGTPDDAGLSRDIIVHFGPTIPVLGVCLGHQCMGEVYGGRVVRAQRLMHGKTSLIEHDGRGVFAGLPNPFEATRYHSLIVPEDSLPPELISCAWVREPGQPTELMGLRHLDYPIHGVQFHPESFLCDAGIRLLENFLRLPLPAAV
ncbi:MAG: aminodeoxychorismate/anthranilate synthase component II, partial [Planctomycetaceae bacterium]